MREARTAPHRIVLVARGRVEWSEKRNLRRFLVFEHLRKEKTQ